MAHIALIPLDGTELSESAFALLPLVKKLNIDTVRLVSVWKSGDEESEAGVEQKQLDEATEKGRAHLASYLDRKAGAVREATRLGVFMLNIHAGGGLAMMRAAAEATTKAAKELALPRPLVLGVTVLTSLDRRALETEAGVPGTVEAHVLRLAERAREAGLDGCVASAHEIGPLRLGLGPRWVIVTPGIRPAAYSSASRTSIRRKSTFC